MISFVVLTYPSSPNRSKVAQHPAIKAPGLEPAIEGDAYTPPCRDSRMSPLKKMY
jgi:hypothetical protein